jgi:hypothetical protein
MSNREVFSWAAISVLSGAVVAALVVGLLM